eukprot:gene43074-64274_t
MAAAALRRGAGPAVGAVADFAAKYAVADARPTLLKPAAAPPAPPPRAAGSAPCRPASGSVLFRRTDDDASAQRGAAPRVDSGAYYAVRLPLLRAGFKRVARDSVQQCNIQRTNHFPGSYLHLGSKDGMWRCLDQTWVLPDDHAALRAFAEGDGSAAAVILKPARGSCGREIHFDVRLYTPPHSAHGVCGGYVAVTSVDPLGIVRFASEPYAAPSAGRRLASLTNSSAPLSAPPSADGDDDVVEPAPAPPPLHGPLLEWEVRSPLHGPLLEWEHGAGRWATAWAEVQDCVVKALVAAERPWADHTPPFEQFGFDVMFDADLRPSLIEVNCIPSLESASAMDYAVKHGSVTDLLNMLHISPFSRDAADMAHTTTSYMVV